MAAFCYSCALSHGLDKVGVAHNLAQSIVRVMLPCLSQLERTMGLSGDGSEFQGPLIGGYDYAGQVGRGGGQDLEGCVAKTGRLANGHEPCTCK